MSETARESVWRSMRRAEHPPAHRRLPHRSLTEVDERVSHKESSPSVSRRDSVVGENPKLSASVRFGLTTNTCACEFAGCAGAARGGAGGGESGPRRGARPEAQRPEP